jgi:bla regulator protein BlaR1
MIIDHLWQSTLFALVAGVLAFVLRNDRASLRYRVWLAASLKFLLPFSLLVGAGRHLAWAPNPAAANGRFIAAILELSQPFAVPTASGNSRILAAAACAVWFCGFAVVLSSWYWRWRRLSAAIRNAVPLREGREVEALRRMERLAGIRNPIAVLQGTASLEPGIFGMLTPVLLWPVGISAHLEDAHLEAVVAHELWHVRRHDNLTGALHMAVEAVFWFHPLVWWLGGRLIDERERACDEKVLEMGGDREVYAESILKTCEFCAGFLPLACVSGAAGADLAKRVADIMASGAVRELSFDRKLLLGTAALATIAVPTLAGSLNAAPTRALLEARNPDGSSAVSALHANRDTPAGTSVVELLAAGSMTGAACPNSESSG